MTPERLTFRQILDETRVESASSAWERAQLASRLRHSYARLGNRRAAQLIGEVKARSLNRVARIIPGQVRITIDHNFQIGLISVRWPGHGSLHLPAGSQIGLDD